MPSITHLHICLQSLKNIHSIHLKKLKYLKSRKYYLKKLKIVNTC